MKFLYMGLGGILGVIGRYLVGGMVYRGLGLGPPFGTFLVNVSGCFAIGLLATLVELKWNMGTLGRAFLFVGFLGAFTTFSTYMFENFTLLDEGRFWLGLGNMVLSVVLGFLALWVGVWLGRSFG